MAKAKKIKANSFAANLCVQKKIEYVYFFVYFEGRTIEAILQS